MSDVFTFRVRYPHGTAGREQCSLLTLINAGKARATREGDGRVRLRFAAPYDDLVLTHGQKLTIEKCARLQAAFNYFGIAVEAQPPCVN